MSSWIAAGEVLLIFALLGSVGVPLILALRSYYRDNVNDQNALDFSRLRKDATSTRTVLPRQMMEQPQLDDASNGVHSPKHDAKRNKSFFDRAHI
ncbi:Aste57867_6522 [Aphanomyces stellatus]|uniref:Aste57867_6522 protein n=1 Tax=Aphanomyces stellatus TaxID=120398 RepID=A0A485KFJ0_9STRA|nr:hypothetical protein As57867_006505 [Aphanomyces stellatus]VFT83504.1 Aste57867_6522 [Aphanomyces stellatus]